MLKNLFIWDKVKPRRLKHFVLPVIILILIIFQDFSSLFIFITSYLTYHYYKKKKIFK